MSARAPLTVAVVGLGYFSHLHLAAWRRIAETEIAGVTDVDAARTREVSRAYDVPGFSTLEELIAATQPDILDIVAPPPAHRAAIETGAARGRTIICQKPFCIDLREARRAVAVAERFGARLAVHENFRFQPWHRTIKAQIDEGLLGQVYQCRFSLRPGDGRGADAYLARQPAFRVMPRLLIHETGVHFMDLFQWLLGPATAVYADVRRLNPHIEGEDEGFVVLDHEGGARSVFDGNRHADHATDSPRRTMGEMIIEGARGTLSLDGAGVVRFRPFGSRTAETVPCGLPVDDDVFGGGCVEWLNRHVVAAILEDGPLENEASEYLRVVAAVEGAYRSAATGRKIDLRPDRMEARE